MRERVCFRKTAALIAAFIIGAGTAGTSMAAETQSYPQEAERFIEAIDAAYDKGEGIVYNTGLNKSDIPGFLSYVVRTSLTEFEGSWLVGTGADGNATIHLKSDRLQNMYAHYEEADKRLDEIYNGFGFTTETSSQKEQIIRSWIQNNAVPDADEACKTNSVYGVVTVGKSRCRGYAITYKKLCERAGLICQTISGKADNGEVEETHLWNRVWIDNAWKYVDVMWQMEGDSELMNHYEEEFYQ